MYERATPAKFSPDAMRPMMRLRLFLSELSPAAHTPPGSPHEQQPAHDHRRPNKATAWHAVSVVHAVASLPTGTEQDDNLSEQGSNFDLPLFNTAALRTLISAQALFRDELVETPPRLHRSTAAHVAEVDGLTERHVVAVVRGIPHRHTAQRCCEQPAATASAARKLLRCDDILDEFHVDARLREVRQPRSQKLQSSID
jgi:hypothetical protein